MVLLAIILLILGIVLALKVLFWLGLILLIAGLVLNFGPVAEGTTRRRWY